jgi:hypothetical protein
MTDIPVSIRKSLLDPSALDLMYCNQYCQRRIADVADLYPELLDSI